MNIFKNRVYRLLGLSAISALIVHCMQTQRCIQIIGDPNDLSSIFNTGGSSGNSVCPTPIPSSDPPALCTDCPTPPTVDPNNLSATCSIANKCIEAANVTVALGSPNFCNDLLTIQDNGPPFNGTYDFTFFNLPATCVDVAYIVTCNGTMYKGDVPPTPSEPNIRIEARTVLSSTSNPVTFTLSGDPNAMAGDSVFVFLQCAYSLIGSTCQSEVPVSNLFLYSACTLP